MKRAFFFVAAFVATVLAVSANAATTTNILLCATSNDATAAAANQTASGWTFSSPGAETQAKEGSYYYPVKFTGSTIATSASVAAGSYMTNLVLGVKVGTVARTVTVTPYNASDVAGTAQTIAPAEQGSLVDVSFPFALSESVSYVKVKIAASGNSTAYLYYATVTTETPSGGGNIAPAATQASIGVNATVGTAVSLDLSDCFTDADGDTLNYAVESGIGMVSGSMWSFTPDAAGSFSAVVSANDPSGASATMLINVTATADGLLLATLLDEGFSGANNAWSQTTSHPGNNQTDCDPWSFSVNSYNARSAVKIGSANSDGAVGWALSPEITLSNELASANVVLSFSAAAYPAKSTKLSVSLVNSATGETNAVSSLTGLSPTALGSATATEWSGGTNYVEEIVAPTRFKLLFETISSASDKRFLLDSIKVTQVYDPNFAVLAAPTGVTSNNVEKFSFTVAWGTVANASGYEVWLDDAPIGICDTTSTNITGLTAGTPYKVQVRAKGDNLHYGDSPLSTAISVTTLADAQKVDFAVTGAPEAPVYAGDTVSFTVMAENEATHAAAEVSFSGIAGATFTAATGTFAWTPTEADVGDNVATFTSGTYSTNVTISVVSAFETETLETENFSQIKSTSWTSTTGYTNRIDGDIGAWTGTDIVKTKSAVIIGRRTSSGTIVSPAVELKARTPGSFSVSFDTGSVPGAKASVRAQILDAADGTVLYTTNFATVAALPADATAVSDASARFTVAPDASVVLPAAVKVAFTTYASAGDDSQRAYVDTVVFTQTVSARIRDLPAPTGLAVVGDPGENGFTVGWTAVSDATNYAVRVTDASGEVAFSAPFCAATQAAVTDLADDEPYAVQVRATGDEATCFASPWSDAIAVRTARSSTHPTLTFGAWQNAVGDGKVYGGLVNTASVSAERDNGEVAAVTLTSVSPASIAGPTLSNGILSWTPADADTNKTFTVSFLMDGTYATNLSFKVLSIAPLAPPEVTVGQPVAWNAIDLSWNEQYRAAGYAVRAWTDCPNPGATATRVEESFAGWPIARPSWWTYHNLASGYKDAAAPVSFDATGDRMETYDLGGSISSVSFHAAGHSISNSTSTLTVVGIGADNTETVLATLTAADIGQTAAGIDRTLSVPAGIVVRKIAWIYTKDRGGVGVGTIVIEGTGFSTPRFLPGWGPAVKDVGLVQGCTVAKPRPGKVLGVNPANKKEDLTEDRINYAEVSVRDAVGASFASVVAVEVPAPPRSARSTLMILR